MNVNSACPMPVLYSAQSIKYVLQFTALFCILDIYYCGKAFLTDVTSEDSCALGGFVFGDTFW